MTNDDEIIAIGDKVFHEYLGGGIVEGKIFCNLLIKFAQLLLAEQWISVDDRLPEHGQRVAWVAKMEKISVHHYMDGEVFGGVFTQDKEGRDGLFSYPGHSMYASFWMPLPLPPTLMNTNQD